MNKIPLYPLRFEPIYQYRLWGGRRLANLLSTPLPGNGPIGEAWILSDREDHPSIVANGLLKGRTIRHLLEHTRTVPRQARGSLHALSALVEVSRRAKKAFRPSSSV